VIVGSGWRDVTVIAKVFAALDPQLLLTVTLTFPQNFRLNLYGVVPCPELV
jgi:hypothetical protein